MILYRKVYFKKGADKVSTIEYNSNVSPTVGYVELIVSNLERSLQFYETVIGFKVLERTQTKASLTTDGKTTLLSLLEDKNAVPKPKRTTGLFHFAILVPTREDLALVLKHLIETEYPLHGASDHLFSEAIYLADPDHNGIEIYADTDAKGWKRDTNGYYIAGTYPLNTKGLLSEMKTNQWNGLPSDTIIGHIHLQVADIDASEKFYVDALGFEIVGKDQQMLFVSKNNYHHHIGLNTWGGVGLSKPPQDSLGLKHFSIHLKNEEIENAKVNLEKLGFSYDETETGIFVTDPSGNSLKVLNEKK